MESSGAKGVYPGISRVNMCRDRVGEGRKSVVPSSQEDQEVEWV